MKKFIENFIYAILTLLVLFYFLYHKGLIFTNFPSIDAQEASILLENDDNVTLLDVRTLQEFKEDGHIESAKLIPISVLQSNFNMLDKSKRVLVYCRSGNRSMSASRVLEANGFEPINLSGGILGWRSLGFEVVK